MQVITSGSTDFNKAASSGFRGLLFYKAWKQERFADIL